MDFLHVCLWIIIGVREKLTLSFSPLRVPISRPKILVLARPPINLFLSIS